MTVIHPPGTRPGATVEPPLRLWRPARVILGHLGTLAASLGVASLLIFLALHYLPGDPAVILAGTESTPAQVATIRDQLGLNRPVLVQYAEWIGRALTGDLGASMLDNRPVAEQIGEKLQVTLPLCFAALALSVAVALPLGMIAGARHRSWYGQLIAAATQLGVAVPAFVAGLALVSFVAVRLGLLPAQGFPRERWDDPAAAALALLLPTITLAIPLTAALIRFVRSSTIDVMGQDWLRTARAQGWSLPVALVRQGIRNASLPLISVIGLELAGLLMGSVLIERVFSLPGIGQMILRDVGNRDLVTVQGTLLVLTAVIMGLTLLTNLIYALVDPRLKGRS